MRALWLILASLLLASAGQAQTFTMPWAPNVQSVGVPGLDGQPILLWNAPSKWDPRPTLRVDRHATEGSGEPWFTYKTIWGLTTTGIHNAGFEWSVTGEVNNYTLGSTGAQNVAVNGTIWKRSNGVGPVGPSWALNGNCVDLSQESPPTYSCIGAELDVSAAAGGPDPNRQRVGLHVAGGGQPGEHIGYAVLLSPGGGATIDRGVAFQTPGASFGIGIDLAPVSFAKAAISLGPRQWVAFDGDSQGDFHHFMGWTGDAFVLMGPAGAPIQARDDGLVEVGRLREWGTHVPGSASSPCQPGDHAWDANFDYRCVAPSRWRRTALSDW